MMVRNCLMPILSGSWQKWILSRVEPAPFTNIIKWSTSKEGQQRRRWQGVTDQWWDIRILHLHSTFQNHFPLSPFTGDWLHCSSLINPGVRNKTNSQEFHWPFRPTPHSDVGRYGRAAANAKLQVYWFLRANFSSWYSFVLLYSLANQFDKRVGRHFDSYIAA